MKYALNLFSPQTYQAFMQSPRDVSGFRQRHMRAAERLAAGDRLLCYLTKVGRWFGILEVLDGPFVDHTPIFYPQDDPFVVRFKVRPIVLLDIEKAVPIRDDRLWNSLSFTKEHSKASKTWTGKLRGSLVEFDDDDAQLLQDILLEQVSESATPYPLDERESKMLAIVSVRRADKDVAVSVPGHDDVVAEDESAPEPLVSESREVQALIADIGARMGMAIWLPRNDRAAVVGHMTADGPTILDRLPLNYDDATLRTIENIDVLWVRGRSIARAFEVEHTTSINSGILRMADLLALQPNMDIKLHIVAPSSRRDKVFQELRRPVFSLLERGPLAEACTYLSYESLRELGDLKHIEHMGDTVLDEYAEDAE